MGNWNPYTKYTLIHINYVIRVIISNDMFVFLFRPKRAAIITEIKEWCYMYAHFNASSELGKLANEIAKMFLWSW